MCFLFICLVFRYRIDVNFRQAKIAISEDLTSDNQHDFNQGTLQQQLLLSIQSRIAKAFERKHHVLVITLEFSIAFDLPVKDNLERRMKIMNYPLQLVKVILNWLSQRNTV
jgi:hypothetical protein